MKSPKIILPFLLCFLAVCFCKLDAQTVAAAPDPCESFDYSVAGKKPHPRLIMDDKEFGQMKRNMKKNPYLQKMHASLMAKADNPKSYSKPLEFKLDVSGKRLLSVSRSALSRITAAAYAYRYTSDRKYLDLAVSDMEAVCSFKNWNQSHYLDVAEMATAVAIGYDWLYGSLTPRMRETAVKAIREFAFDTSINAEKAPGFYKAKNNWNQVCNAGLVCAALATYESDPVTAVRAIIKSVNSNRPIISLIYAPDGSYPEGPGYWSYGTGFQLLLNSCLETVLGTDFGLYDEKGFASTGYYKVFSKSNIDKSFNFSDASDGGGSAPELWYFAWKNSDPGLVYTELPVLDTYGKSRLSILFSIKYASLMGNSQISCTPKRVYSSQGINPIVMARSGWNASDAYLGIKAGTASANHAHMDAGEFVFDIGGHRWAMDYTRPDYAPVENCLKPFGEALFSKKQNATRWQIYGLNNRQHNTLTVNDKDHNVKGMARLVEVIDEPSRLGGTVDFADTFFDDLKSALRTVVIADGARLEVTDAITARDDAPAHIRWSLVTKAKVDVTPGGLVLTIGKDSMTLSADGASVQYRTWPSSPSGYDLPTKDFPAPKDKGATLCGFEFDVPAGASVTVKTTLKQ